MSTHSFLTTAGGDKSHHIISCFLEIAKYISNFSQEGIEVECLILRLDSNKKLNSTKIMLSWEVRISTFKMNNYNIKFSYYSEDKRRIERWYKTGSYLS